MRTESVSDGQCSVVTCTNEQLRLESANMPTYVYEGLQSGTRFEIAQRITEAALTHSPETGEPVKRIIFASGIVFKGSGFYKNDSRPPESSKSESIKPSSKTDATQSDSSAAKPEPSATPAATPVAPKTTSAE